MALAAEATFDGDNELRAGRRKASASRAGQVQRSDRAHAQRAEPLADQRDEREDHAAPMAAVWDRLFEPRRHPTASAARSPAGSGSTSSIVSTVWAALLPIS